MLEVLTTRESLVCCIQGVQITDNVSTIIGNGNNKRYKKDQIKGPSLIKVPNKYYIIG